jgi:AcrR family transcriptional regulator
MTKVNQAQLLETAAQMYAQFGYADFSIRKLAARAGIAHSVIYHHYVNEASLLKAMFEYASSELGRRRKLLPDSRTAETMLRRRIEFQVDNAELIVAVLKYYLSHRLAFEATGKGFVPDKSALHIEEVLEYGMRTGEFQVDNLADESKVIAHAINGFLLEYYPHAPSGEEKNELISRIHLFLMKALKGGEKL